MQYPSVDIHTRPEDSYVVGSKYCTKGIQEQKIQDIEAGATRLYSVLATYTLCKNCILLYF